MNLFGMQIDAQWAPELHLAWEAVESDLVDGRALELATSAAEDPELARRTTASLRLELGPPPVSWAAALEIELGAQMWSLRRLATRRED